MKRLLCMILAAVLLVGTYSNLATEVSATQMSSSAELITIIKQLEGFSPKPYLDNTQYSIGYGSRVPDGMLDYYNTHGITEEEAHNMLLQMLTEYETAVVNFAVAHNLVLTQNQFDALVSFSYNCGYGWTNEITGNMNRAIREGWTGSDLVYAFLLWSSSAGQYILINRRLSEANMYINGVYNKDYDQVNGTFRYAYLDAGIGKVRYVIHGFDITDPKPIKAEITNTPAGYVFEGWYTAPGGGVKVTALDSSIPSGTVLYAGWMDTFGNVLFPSKATPITPTGVQITGSVNNRTGPGTYYPSLGMLPAGTTVTLTGIYSDGRMRWGQHDGGWISLDYTNYDAVTSGQSQWPKSGTITGSDVNIRYGPGTSHGVAYKLNTGNAVTIHEQAFADNLAWGRLDDGCWVALKYVTFGAAPQPGTPTEPAPGVPSGPPKSADVNGTGTIDKDDAIYLLRHVVYPEKYPISVNCDVDGSGAIDKNDAIYLLRYVVYPDKYPLKLGV